MGKQDDPDSFADDFHVVTELHQVLRPLEELEELMMQFYEHCAGRFKDDAEASALFSRLAFEERSHAAQIRYLRRLVERNKEPMAPVEVDLNEVAFEVGRLQSAMPLSNDMCLPDALEFALACERGAAEMHSRAAIAGGNPALEGLIRNLGQADRVHLARLEGFLASRRTDI